MDIEKVIVEEHEYVGNDYSVLKFKAPIVAGVASPGQFIHLLIPRLEGSILRRPFSIYKVEGEFIYILYKAVGRGTKVLMEVRVGDKLSVMGPLGNDFPVCNEDEFPVFIAGGFGVAPLSFLAKTLPVKGHLFVGGASNCDILCIDDFEAVDCKISIATVDGSVGEQGFVTKPFMTWYKEFGKKCKPVIYSCGPDAMLRAVGEFAVANDIKCYLSLDKHMGCGIGACLACVQKVYDAEGTIVQKRVCKDGPIFSAESIVWEEE
ncbi:MAG: dihydroorotate dehydrogenase electron transfer subunit [Kiritimatiellae bacterium]|jgi:dihydroorotate dehydrogenase electron transfer subunit|nr:dihydroorotate dehydrogenase electron transfer subunit [Kiritimatiellia bacterium]